MLYDLVVIGGGAAGFFGAISAADKNRNLRIAIVDKHSKFLSKVRVSGGGRCNVTHHCSTINSFLENYPRGSKELRNVFASFSPNDIIKWYENRGVKLKTEADGRMFPVSDSSETIIDCLINETRKLGIELYNSVQVQEVSKDENSGLFILKTNRNIFEAKSLLIACGGFSKIEHYDFIKKFGHEIIPPVPSLFTFQIPDKKLHALSGISLQNAEIIIPEIKYKDRGATLITHWGLSGPAILKASAWAARELYDKQYHFELFINWLGLPEEEIKTLLSHIFFNHKKGKLNNIKVVGMPAKFWLYILEISGINSELMVAEISKKQLNTIVANFFRCPYSVTGKSTFKEEFVTCGGVALKEINMKTMESKKMSSLYFAGEIIDIDGVTGGFNFQAAWSTAWVAGNTIATQIR